MKTKKILYWIFTGLISAFMLLSSYMYLTKNPQLIEDFQKLGYPIYFVTLLGIVKFLGAIALVQPRWKTLQEWAYAGFTFTFVGAVWTHVATGTSFIAALIALVLLGLSYWFRCSVLCNCNCSENGCNCNDSNCDCKGKGGNCKDNKCDCKEK